MAMSKQERIAAIREKHDKMLAEYKDKLAAKRAEYVKRIKAAEKSGTGDRMRRERLMVYGFSELLKSAKADATGKKAAEYAKLFRGMADATAKPRAKLNLEEIARMFEKRKQA